MIILSYNNHHIKEVGMVAAEFNSLRLALLFDENRDLSSRVLEVWN